MMISSNHPPKDAGTRSGVSLKPTFSEPALNKAKVRRRADLQRVSVAEPGKTQRCSLGRAGLQSSSPESALVAQTPPRPTVRTWQDMSEVTAPAAADGAQTHKNA